jgi:hypothetical protein
MTLREAEQAQHLFSGRPLAQTLFGVDRQLRDLLALHGLAKLPLDERLHEQR